MRTFTVRKWAHGPGGLKWPVDTENERGTRRVIAACATEADAQFIVDAANAAEQRAEDDRIDNFRYGSWCSHNPPHAPMDFPEHLLMLNDELIASLAKSEHYAVVKDGKIVRYERPRPGDVVELAPGESLAPHPDEIGEQFRY